VPTREPGGAGSWLLLLGLGQNRCNKITFLGKYVFLQVVQLRLVRIIFLPYKISPEGFSGKPGGTKEANIDGKSSEVVSISFLPGLLFEKSDPN
jgi:hypothetical protein